MRFRFTGDGGEIDVLASNVPNDPFYEFVTAIQAVFERGCGFDVWLNEEPRVSILTVEKSGEKLALSLKNKDGSLRERVEADFSSACREISRNLYQLYKEVGYERFAIEWRNELPGERIRDLWGKVGVAT
jgi:hypothetical protein